MEKELERRLSALEARVAQMEGQRGAEASAPGPPDGDFWALNGLMRRGFDGVLFTGNVTLPAGGEVGWQYALRTPAALEQSWEDAAPVFAALGHPARLIILRSVLGGQGRTAELGELEELGSTGQLYHHLRELVAAGWLKAAGRGQHRVPAERVVPLLVMLSASDRLETSPQSPGDVQ